MKSLTYFAVKEVIHRLGNEELKELQALLPKIIQLNTEQAQKKLEEAVRETIPGNYNHPERDWRVVWRDDKMFIYWDHGCSQLSISDTTIVFEAHTYNGAYGIPYYTAFIITIEDKLWTSGVEKDEEIYNQVKEDHKKFSYKRENVNTFEEWLEMVIRAYVPLVLNYQHIKDKYYEGVNNIRIDTV